eukprot:CAMPEP_0167805252 /NCGR_PEP_ID=MMETSP0111_2-20121227/21063_1 /TAXON_ID=91324 /ORGANISM="Lotharella globosa, Strain CCCM811" /LENGTH=182 /DNA_ID=CAMNT_0007702361 /DNA_START=104 /DNA_END=652 /DNA_ORIENTATION=+
MDPRLLGLVMSYLVPGLDIPSKLQIDRHIFEPQDLPMHIRLKKGRSMLDVNTGSRAWILDGFIHIARDLKVTGSVHHTGGATRSQVNKLTGHWNRSSGKLMLHAYCMAFGEQHLVGVYAKGNTSLELDLLQAIADDAQWRWIFDEVSIIDFRAEQQRNQQKKRLRKMDEQGGRASPNNSCSC